MSVKLTPKQEKFAQLYIELGNASAAYRGSYNCGKMKAASIDRNAHAQMKNTKIASRIEELRAHHMKRHEVTVDRVLNELSLLGFSNMLDYMTPQKNGTAIVDFSQLTRDHAAAIQEITVDSYLKRDPEGDDDFRTVERVKFKLYDKKGALVDMGRHLGMFKEAVEVSGKNGGPIETKDVSDIEGAQRVAYMLGLAVARGRQSAERTQA